MRLIKRLVGILFWLSFFCFCAGLVSPRIAALVEEHISLPLRTSLSGFTSVLPIPLFELLIPVLPILLTVMLVKGRLSAVTTVAKLLFISYVITLGTSAAAADRITDVRALETEDYIAVARVIVDGLCDTAHAPSAYVASEAAFVAAEYAGDRLLVMGVTVPMVKATLVPDVLTRMGVIAYYAFPTAEVVVNTAAPDFMIALSSAHETMHLSGITDEDEANLFAIAALLESGDATLEFYAYLNAFVYVGSRICTQNRDTYNEICALLPDKAREQLARRSDFLSKKSGTLGRLSASLNDAAITLRDSRGSDSYSESAALIAAYFLQ